MCVSMRRIMNHVLLSRILVSKGCLSDFGFLVSQVGDFGLARWQPDGDMGVETRVIGTFG